MRRRLLFPALLILIGLMILAAWRHEIRPSFLDGAHAFAERSLQRVAIYVGDPVFGAEVELADARGTPQEICIEVLSRDVGAPARLIFPDYRECPIKTMRPHMRPEEVMFARVMMTATADEATRRSAGIGASAPGYTTAADALLRSLASHFVQRERVQGRRHDEYSVIVRQHVVEFATGDVIVVPLVYFTFSGDGTPGRQAWFPPQQQADAWWQQELNR